MENAGEMVVSENVQTLSFSRTWSVVFLMATLVALLHALPYIVAQIQTPPDWYFTGNLNTSPDLMQYYSWARQTPDEGIIVTNKFTHEPNQPHLVVLLYFLIGHISQWTGIPPEYVYTYIGSLFAFLFAILLFIVVRWFTQTSYQAWVVFVLLLIGGGLDPHLRILSNIEIVRNNYLLERTLLDGLWQSVLFDNLRGQYIFTTIFDTHFLLIWIVTTAAVFSLYFALTKTNWQYTALATFLFALMTVVHLYEGITLLAIAYMILFLFWRKGLFSFRMLIPVISCTIAVAITLLWQALLFRSSGLPIPEWREVNMLFSAVFLAFPLCWIVIASGLGDYWQQSSYREVFILGWMLGCLAITLSGPFYPYPTRGTVTLQIPVYLAAAGIYFSRFPKLTRWAVVLIIVFMCVLPAHSLENWLERAQFNREQPHKFMSPDHYELVSFLEEKSMADDLLLTKDDHILWVGPYFRGRHYCGHFFLTVDYEQKCANTDHFYTSSAAEQQAFLEDVGIRYVFAGAGDNPEQLKMVPGLLLLQETAAGAIFEFRDEVTDVAQ